MPAHKSSDYKLSAVKYYLSHSKNQVQSCKIFGLGRRFKCSKVYKIHEFHKMYSKKSTFHKYLLILLNDFIF